MQVDRRNFEEVLPDFKEKLRECTFVAIDAEFSGLGPPPEHQWATKSLFDSAERRYRKARDCSCYFICQFGIALFKQSVGSNYWEVDSYNFYLYPASFENFARDEPVFWELSSVNFLKEFNFDFDLLFEHGIPYMNKGKTEDFRTYLNSAVSKDGDSRSKEEIVERFRGFSRLISALSDMGKPIVGHNMYTDLILMYHHLVNDLPETYLEFKEQVHKLFPQIYDTKVIAAGMRKYLSSKNPDEEVSYLANTSLYSLYKNTSDPPGPTKPTIRLGSTSSCYREVFLHGKKEDLESIKPADSKCHEAGFDACVTGAVFTQLAYIMWQHELASKCLPHNRPFEDIFDRVYLWVNQINLSRARLPLIHLAGQDPSSHRPPLIYIEGTSTGTGEINLKNLIRHLGQFGGCEGINSGYGKKKALIACPTEKCSFLALKYLKLNGYRVSEVRVPGDDNVKPKIPWKGFIICASTAWTITLIVLWRRMF